jgi:iron complex outermembrane receptor protein
MKKILLLATLLVTMLLNAQEMIVSGIVKDKAGITLPGATISVKNSQKSTTSDIDGKYSIKAKDGDKLQISFLGMETKLLTVKGSIINVVLEESGVSLNEIVVVGSRKKGRVSLDTPVAIDVINISSSAAATPQTDLTQILNYAAPSFTSNTTTVADGTDHIDPAQLRGLGPDQVLVLLNGKRRHTTSLVNVNGTPGRGSVGTDLNSIPSFAIDRLEVLRDGAAAQYGSDAIAGVINVAMKKGTGKLEGSLVSGGNFSDGANDHTGGVDGIKHQLDLNYGFKLKDKGFINLTTSLQKRDLTSRAGTAAGTIFNAYNAVEKRALNNGVNISSLFSNITNTPNSNAIIGHIKNFAPQVGYFTTAQQSAIQSATTISALQGALGFDVTDQEIAFRGLNRKDFNMRVGQSELISGQFFLNSEYEINSNVKAYAFGGYSYRNGNAAGFYRRPNAANGTTSIYENGHLPEIDSDVKDFSLATGFKGRMGKFDFDFSNTFGTNSFDYTIKNTANASMPFPSKTEFNAGGLGFTQNTVNLDFTRKFDYLEGLNLAFGSEYRYENYQISAGEESSWALYDINGNIQTATTANNLKPTTFFNAARPGGAQVFPGFRPTNATDKNRSSVAAYVDIELDITEKWLVSTALRLENYSDFGSTFNYKIASRYKITDNFALRAAHSTGFRAPSLAQLYFQATGTQFVGGEQFEVGTFANDSQLATKLGIPQLKQEVSQSFSAGFTAKIPKANLSFTVDGFYISIDDRVVLTDQFARGAQTADVQAIFNAAGANAATFFSNAIDTRTAGIEAVIAHKATIGKTTLNSDFAVTQIKTERVGDIKASPLLASGNNLNIYFSERSRIFLEEAIPRFKASLNNNLSVGKFNVYLRNVYFGEVTDPNATDINDNGLIEATIINGQAVETEFPVFGGNIVTDLSVGYKINENLKITLGANNLFDIYPDLNIGPKTARRPNATLTNGAIMYPNTPVSIDLTSNDQFVYSRNVSQFGQNGRFLFARLNFTF